MASLGLGAVVLVRGVQTASQQEQTDQEDQDDTPSTGSRQLVDDGVLLVLDGRRQGQVTFVDFDVLQLWVTNVAVWRLGLENAVLF